MKNQLTTEEQNLSFKLNLDATKFLSTYLLNLVQTIFTLGLYYFQANTNIRKYFIEKISLKNENLLYKGTATELFYSFLIIFLLINLPKIIYLLFFVENISTLLFIKEVILPIKEGNHSLIYNKFIISWGAFSYLLLFMGCWYNGHKYRASKISWRGVNFILKGSSIKYALLLIYNILFGILTLNLLAPYLDLKVKSYLWNNLSFGKNKFTINVSYKPLMRINIITSLLAIPTLFVSRLWYYAALDRYVYSNLEIENIRMTSAVTGGKLLKLASINILLVIITCGLAIPYIIKRTTQFYIENHSIVGDIDQLTYENPEQEEVSKDYSIYFEGPIITWPLFL